MNRLTFRLGESNPSYGLVDKASAKPGLFTDYDGFYAHLLASHRLGEYEDLSYSPVELAEKLEKLKEWEEKGVMLPCKVGDTVFWTSHFGTGINQGEITAIKISKFGFDLEIFRQQTSTAINREFEKVFLTREEAEKALGRNEK